MARARATGFRVGGVGGGGLKGKQVRLANLGGGEGGGGRSGAMLPGKF